MQGNIDETTTSQDQNKHIQRIMNNSYHGVLTTTRPLTLIERRYHKFMRAYYNNMRDRDLYEATHKYEQLLTACTQNTKFDWGTELIAQMLYYGLDANKAMMLQSMRYPRGSARWLWIMGHCERERLMMDLDNHNKPNLYAVVNFNRDRLKIWVPFAYKLWIAQLDEKMFLWMISKPFNAYRAKLFELGFDWTYGAQPDNIKAYLKCRKLLRGGNI